MRCSSVPRLRMKSIWDSRKESDITSDLATLYTTSNTLLMSVKSSSITKLHASLASVRWHTPIVFFGSKRVVNSREGQGHQVDEQWT